MNQSEKSNPKNTRTNVLGRIARRLILFPILAIAGLYFLSLTAAQPDNLGVVDGQLAQCLESPNCVSTQSNDSEKTMPAIAIVDGGHQTLSKIKSAISSNYPKAKLISESDSYLHYEFTSLLFRFVDDVEFYADDSKQVVHFRSASRVGHSDMGANKKRMSKICESLKQ